MGYGYTSDTQERRGFINKSKILQYVTEEEIFSLVFGYLPREFEYVTSPFREDTTPGCWFERRGDTLRFIDYGARNKFFPDCFGAVQSYFGIPNFYTTLEFIYEHLIKGKNLNPVESAPTAEAVHREEVIIRIEARNFIAKDGDYWNPYGISRQNLKDDGVFAVSRYVISNTRAGTIDIRVNTPCYGYTEFSEGRKKLYLPYAEKGKRFITNCQNDDIGGMDALPLYGDQLIITKSYKDCRVVRNTKRTSVWFQNERIIPNLNILMNLVKRFTKVIVLYDNDKTGIEQCQIIADEINRMFPGKARPLWLPIHLQGDGITDPADLREDLGEHELENFFKSNLI